MVIVNNEYQVMYIYGIMCHQLNAPLIHLIRQLSKSDKTVILLHVDKKCNIGPFLSEFSSNNKVKFTDTRINVKWGGYSQIEATLEILKESLNYDFRYFSLLSGVDILIKNVFELEKYLENNDKDYIGGVINKKYDFRVKYRFPEFYFLKEKSIYNKVLCLMCRGLQQIGFLKQKLDNFPQLYYGANWFTLRKKTIEYVLDYLKKNEFYSKAFYQSLCGDELFFQTIIFNSPSKNEIYGIEIIDSGEKVLRYIDWKSGPEYPKVLMESDYQKMKDSGLFFARKIDVNTSLDILEKNFKA